jgi:hypothetical protein
VHHPQGDHHPRLELPAINEDYALVCQYKNSRILLGILILTINRLYDLWMGSQTCSRDELMKINLRNTSNLKRKRTHGFRTRMSNGAAGLF